MAFDLLHGLMRKGKSVVCAGSLVPQEDEISVFVTETFFGSPIFEVVQKSKPDQSSFFCYQSLVLKNNENN